MAKVIGDGATDATIAAEMIRGKTIDTAMGPLTWDQKGDLIGFEFGIYKWHADGTGTPL